MVEKECFFVALHRQLRKLFKTPLLKYFAEQPDEYLKTYMRKLIHFDYADREEALDSLYRYFLSFCDSDQQDLAALAHHALDRIKKTVGKLREMKSSEWNEEVRILIKDIANNGKALGYSEAEKDPTPKPFEYLDLDFLSEGISMIDDPKKVEQIQRIIFTMNPFYIKSKSILLNSFPPSTHHVLKDFVKKSLEGEGREYPE